MKRLEDFHVFQSEEAWAWALCDVLCTKIEQLLSQQTQVVLAVSGGKSPQAVFELLSHKPLDWSRVRVQLVDERLLTQNHPQSNGQLVQQYLLQNHAAKAKWHNLLPETTEQADVLDENAREQVLQDALARYEQPDIVVLGMGEDAHTASLFPNAAQLSAGLALDAPDYVLIEPPVAPYWRLSMSLSAILRTPNIYIAAWGTSKRDVLQQAANQLTDAMPISHVLHSAQGSQLHVYC